MRVKIEDIPEMFFRRLVVPRLYRLALQLRQHGVTSLRFGAVNCATEHQLCTEQGWLGMAHETHDQPARFDDRSHEVRFF